MGVRVRVRVRAGGVPGVVLPQHARARFCIIQHSGCTGYSRGDASVSLYIFPPSGARSCVRTCISCICVVKVAHTFTCA